MKKNAVRKLLVSFSAVAVAFAVSAGEVAWTGGSTTSTNWSDTANWSGETLPTSADKATFPLAEQTVRLDGDYSVSDFFVAADASALFYNDDVTRTNTLTISALDTIGESGAEIMLSGPVQVNVGDDGNRLSKASVIVSNGASFVATKLDHGTSGGQKLIAKGPNSQIEVGSIVLGTETGDNPNNSLEAYDGGSITVSDYPTSPKSAYTIIATNGSTIVATDLSLGGSFRHSVTCEDSRLQISSFAGSGNGAVLRVGGTGFLKSGGVTVANSAQKRYQSLWLYGSDPRIDVTGTKGTSFVFGNNAYPGCGSLNLAPEPTWKESVARMVRTATSSGDCKILINKGVKFNIDCSGFAAYYGKRQMRLFEQKRASWISTIVTPTGDYLVLSGEGAECCDVSFSTNIAERAYFMTMVSTNAVPPANAVAGVNNIGKSTLFYSTLAEAIEVAAAADDEEVDIVLTRRATIDVLENPGSKPIRIYALKPVTLSTANGTAGTGIVIGENVTLKKKTGFVLSVQ